METSGSGAHVNTDKLKTMPMLLGSSDPLRLARYLPSMQAASELDSGLHIQGNDNSHNVVSSGGAPIYGATHLLGLFSVFNPSHYSSMSYSTWAPDANRLGGRFDMALPQKTAERVGGDFSAGLLSAQGSLHVPIGRSSVTASVRRSYINLLYGPFMKLGDKKLRYGFTDANLTWLWTPASSDKIWLDGYWGNDAAAIISETLPMDTEWMNAMGAVHWQHGFDTDKSLKMSAFVTTYGLDFNISFSDIRINLSSSILTAGYNASVLCGPWNAGLGVQVHRARPQTVRSSGYFNAGSPEVPDQNGQEMTLHSGYSGSFGPFSVDARIKGILWHSPDGRWMPGVGPDVQLAWDFYSAGKVTARAGMQHQYLMQTGVTDLGLPVEFWFLAGEYNEPQKSIAGSLVYDLRFPEDAFAFSAELYYKKLYNQVEYRNGFLDLVYSRYSLGETLLRGDGRAWGLNLIFHKKAGKLTGWIAYSYGRSLRRFDGPGKEYPSSHERRHEFDAVASYSTGKWSFGLTALAAEGTPYTPASALYVLANRIMVQYGEHNSARLSWYNRLDLSVNYFFNRGERLENGINFSVYNILGFRNELYRHLVIEDDGFSYAPDNINIRFMPSLCYFHKF